MPKVKAALILSGGLDSTILLYDLVNKGLKVFPISFFYGQENRVELKFANRSCLELGLTHTLINLDSIMKYKPKTKIKSVGNDPGKARRAEDVPNRNMILLAIAGGYAIQHGARLIYYGAHKPPSTEYVVYPDCRPDFVGGMRKSFEKCDWKPLRLKTPYLNLAKSSIVKKGQRLQVPFENTWSCYRAGRIQCGRCVTCVDRLKAFEVAGIEDPAQYVDRKYWKKF